MRPNRTAMISLAANALMAALLLWLFVSNRTRRDQPKAQAVTSLLERQETVPQSFEHHPVAQPFRWSQVESTNYAIYVANLRAIGCPEQTVRDIIIADVNQLFAPRYAALRAAAPELAWWGKFDDKRPVRAGLAAQLRALDSEKKSVLQRLLGESSSNESPVETSVSLLREDITYAFLPESKRNAVRDLVRRYHALENWAEVEWKGLPTDEKNARAKRLRDARAGELAAILTPDELSEFNLRDSFTADQIRERFGRGDLTEAEFRKLYELRREFEQRVSEPTREDRKRLEADSATTLGADRFADLQRQNDLLWRTMQDIAGEQNLSTGAMQKAYAIQQEYADKLLAAIGRMFGDPAQNPQPVRDVISEMDARLTEALGATAVGQLDRLNALPRLVVQDDGQRKIYSLSRAGFSN